VVGKFDPAYFVPALQRGCGGSSVCVGIVDKISRKTMPYSLNALIHLSMGKLHLFNTDYPKEEKLTLERI
jgi:hypothetical protein